MSREVIEWLRSIGLERYADAFIENEIEVGLILSLTPDDLRDLGVVSVGHRRRMLNSIAKLKSARDGPAEGTGRIDQRTPRLGQAERRHLTILFCDLVGSTALSERLDPEDLRTVLTEYSRTVTTVVEHFNGFIAQYIGDGVLSYFGWPQALEDDAERAVRAALSVTEAVGNLKTIQEEAISCRVGIASGSVVVGDLVGDYAVDDNHVVGRTPNLAARLQSMANPGEVVISPETKKLIRDRFVLERLTPQNLKGIQGDVEAWKALRVNEGASRFGREASADTSIFGRKEDLDHISRAFSHSMEGKAQTIAVRGDAGIGKSKLLESCRQIAEDGGFRVMDFQCSPYHINEGLFPITEQFRFAAGIDLREEPEFNLSKLTNYLNANGIPPEPATSFIAPLLGITEATGPEWEQLDSQGRKERTFEVLFTCFDAIVDQSPIVVLFEDVHWADPTTLELMRRFVRRNSDKRVATLFSTRNEGQLQYIEDMSNLVIRLDRLSQDDAHAIVRSIPGAAELPNEMVELILERTDGVPLFVEELTKTVLETGLATKSLDGTLNPVSIPTTLQGSLLARLDLLPTVKYVAQTASVIGRNFSLVVLAATLNADSANLRASLNKLTEAEILMPREGDSDTFTFKHQLLRDAIYSSLLRGDLPDIHRRIALAMEDETVPSVSSAHLLANHWALAGDHGRAAFYYASAGEGARKRYENAEATSYLRLALTHLDFSRRAGGERYSNEPDRIQLIEDMSDVLLLSNDIEEASAVLDQAIQAPDLPPLTRARLLRRLGAARQQDRDFSIYTLDRAEQALGKIDDNSDADELTEWIDIQIIRLTVHYWSGDSQALLDLSRRVIPFIGQAKPLQRALIYAQLVQRDLRAYRYRTTNDTLENAAKYVEAAQESGVLSSIASAQFILGFVHLHNGTLEDAKREMGEGLKSAQKSGHRAIELRCLVYLATVYRRLGEVMKAEQLSRESLDLAAREAMPEYTGMAHAHLAWARWKEGNLVEAKSLGQDAMAEFQNSRIAYPFEWAAGLVMVAIAAEEQDPEAGRHICARLIDGSQQHLPDQLNEAAEAVATRGTEDMSETVAQARSLGFL